jgi:hypothetical protein
MAQTNRFQSMTLCIMPAVFAVYMPMCAPRVTPNQRPWDVPMAQLWEKPLDLESRDLYYGPWGPERAPDPAAPYTFVAKKAHGTNPGMTVTDPGGREWSVKQAPHNDQGAEGPVEVVLSRILSAVGYHQPPVYFVPSFTITDATGTHTEPGGRFRLKTDVLAKRGDWSWQQNPFVGTRPYQGLLVILMMFDSSDLKNVNNTLYAVNTPGDPPQLWYVVRDLGTALGETGRLAPKRSDPDLFERNRFINGMKDGYVEFDYHGWHQELLRHRITPQEVRWASDLLTGISYRQWTDAFRAGGYEPAVAERFIRRILAKVAEGERLGIAPPPLPRVAPSSFAAR